MEYRNCLGHLTWGSLILNDCTAFLSKSNVLANEKGQMIPTRTITGWRKSDVFTTFKPFVKGIHNEFETTIKRVRSDNGSEFKNTRIDDLCDDFGIRHQFSAKYTPQLNGRWLKERH